MPVGVTPKSASSWPDAIYQDLSDHRCQAFQADDAGSIPVVRSTRIPWSRAISLALASSEVDGEFVFPVPPPDTAGAAAELIRTLLAALSGISRSDLESPGVLLGRVQSTVS
jgi:hypothetical protein